MRILVVGAGSVGGFFGARLAAAGRDVTFLVREKRAEQLRRDGLRVIALNGDLTTIAPKTITADKIDGPYDAILLAVKTYSLEAAMQDFAAAVGPETMILPLLNGMCHLDMLSARFNTNNVIGGLSHVSTDLDSEGVVKQLAHFEDLVYGELSGADTPRIRALAAELRNAGFQDELVFNVEALMWEKWVMLSSSAVITCLLRGSIGAVIAVQQGRETALAIIAECATVANAEGHPMSEAAMEFTIKRLTAADSKFTASMYRDLMKGAPVEVENVFGDLLARGIARGLETPNLRAACVQLGVYMNSRASKD
jgi:2-dehydropantoate 2-reductase